MSAMASAGHRRGSGRSRPRAASSRTLPPGPRRAAVRGCADVARTERRRTGDCYPSTQGRHAMHIPVRGVNLSDSTTLARCRPTRSSSSSPGTRRTTLPAVLDELHAGLPAATSSSSTTARRTGTGSGRAVARRGGPLASVRTVACSEGIAAGYACAESSAGTRYVGEGRRRRSASRRRARAPSRDRDARRRDVAVGSRFATGEGYEAYRYEPSSSRRLGHRSCAAPCAPRSVDRSTTRRAGCARQIDKRCPRLGDPYTSGAPEVESLLRLRDAGLDVVEVPGAHARAARAASRSCAEARRCSSSLTVAGTLLLYGVWRRLRRPAMTSLVAVLSATQTAARHELHRVCAARPDSRRAMERHRHDVVLFSGWARRGVASCGGGPRWRTRGARPVACAGSCRSRAPARRSATRSAGRAAQLGSSIADEVVLVDVELARARAGIPRFARPSLGLGSDAHGGATADERSHRATACASCMRGSTVPRSSRWSRREPARLSRRCVERAVASALIDRRTRGCGRGMRRR